jgi:hypothetical protein
MGATRERAEAEGGMVRGEEVQSRTDLGVSPSPDFWSRMEVPNTPLGGFGPSGLGLTLDPSLIGLVQIETSVLD